MLQGIDGGTLATGDRAALAHGEQVGLGDEVRAAVDGEEGFGVDCWLEL